MAFCVTCVFTVTLSVFPAITVNTKSSGLFEGESTKEYNYTLCFSKHFDLCSFSSYREHLHTFVFIHCLQCDGLDRQKSHFSFSVGESHQILYQSTQYSAMIMITTAANYSLSNISFFISQIPSLR